MGRNTMDQQTWFFPFSLATGVSIYRIAWYLQKVILTVWVCSNGPQQRDLFRVKAYCSAVVMVFAIIFNNDESMLYPVKVLFF